MRQKKSNAIFYILGVVILAGLFFALSRDVSVKTEVVEQPLENTFLNK